MHCTFLLAEVYQCQALFPVLPRITRVRMESVCLSTPGISAFLSLCIIMRIVKNVEIILSMIFFSVLF